MAGEQPQRYIPPQRRGSARDAPSSFDSNQRRRERQAKRADYDASTKPAEHDGSDSRRISLSDRKERIALRNQQRQEAARITPKDSRPRERPISLGIQLAGLAGVEEAPEDETRSTPPSQSTGAPSHDYYHQAEASLETSPQMSPTAASQVETPSADRLLTKTRRHGKQVIARYHTSQSGRLTTGTSSGCSLYESLAILLYEELERSEQIKSTIMQRYIWIYNNESHPLHEECREHTSAYYKETCGQLFSALECPDLADWNVDLLWTIAALLDISLLVYQTLSKQGEAQDLLFRVGDDTLPCHSLLHGNGKGELLSSWSALVPDRSGKELIEYLSSTQSQLSHEAQRGDSNAHDLRLERVSWAVTQSGTREKITCYNGFRQDSRMEHLAVEQDNPSQLHTFQLMVQDSRQIPGAIEILKNALERAPKQRLKIDVSESCKPGILLPFASSDAEFTKVPREKIVGKSTWQCNELLERGEVELLPSLFTATVDFLLIQFHLLHMMEHPDENTVPNLQLLGEEIIFNPQVDLWWWNPQQDVTAMDNFYAHLFQGTPREPYNHIPHNSHQSYVVTPTFKIISPFFQGQRPEHLNFPRQLYDCELHKNDVLSERGFACPCATGNHDIAALLSEACRQHGRNLEKPPWTEPRRAVKLARLIERVLKSDPRVAIFKDMKGCVPAGQEQEFYQSLGQPGMEQDDNQLKYATGDALVPGIVLKMLLTNDMDLRRQVLTGWVHAPDASDIGNADAVYTPEVRLAAVVEGIPLFDYFPPRTPHSAKVNDRPLQFKTTESFLHPRALMPWEHDVQVGILRQIQRESEPRGPPFQKALHEPLAKDDVAYVEKAKLELCTRRTDLRKIYFPETCATPLSDNGLSMIVRSNMTYSEALFQFLNGVKPHDKFLPTGFGARHGERGGLPDSVDRVPGQDLPAARNIFDALGGDYNEKLHDLPPSTKMNLPSLKLEYQEISDVHLVAEALKAVPINRSPKTFRKGRNAAKAILQAQVDEEVRVNEEQGLPSFVDVTDVLDPEGRDYRRRMEEAPEYLRQPLLHVPSLGPDGEWQSKLTMRLAMVKAMPDDLVDTVDAWEGTE